MNDRRRYCVSSCVRKTYRVWSCVDPIRPRAPAVMASSSEGRVTGGTLSNGERGGIGSVCVCACVCVV